MKINTQLSGIYLAISAGIISGISIWFNKLVITTPIDTTVFNIIKNGGVGLVLSLILIKTGIFSQFKLLTAKQRVLLLIVSVIGGSIPFLLFFEGLKNTNALTSNVIQKSLFLWVSLFAIPALGEKMSKKLFFGYVFLGMSILAIGMPKFSGTGGEALILLATIFWALETILVKKLLPEVHPLLAAWFRMFVGSVFMLLYAVFQGKLEAFVTITPTHAPLLFGSIFLLSLYVSSWYTALAKTKATIVSALLMIAPGVTLLLTTMQNQTLMSRSQLMSTGLLFTGILLILRETTTEYSKTHER